MTALWRQLMWLRAGQRERPAGRALLPGAWPPQELQQLQLLPSLPLSWGPCPPLLCQWPLGAGPPFQALALQLQPLAQARPLCGLTSPLLQCCATVGCW